jgi:hypothetical protein
MSVSKLGVPGVKGGEAAQPNDAKFALAETKEKKVAVVGPGMSKEQIAAEIASWKKRGISVRNKGNEHLVHGNQVNLGGQLVATKKSPPGGQPAAGQKQPVAAQSAQGHKAKQPVEPPVDHKV